MRIVVLAGGASREREVSLRSGQACARALESLGYEVELCDPGGDLEGCLLSLEPRPDLVFNVLHGGAGEGGVAQEICERFGLPYTGPGPEASRLGMDKPAAKARFREAGILTPDWEVVSSCAIEGYRPPFTPPLVVKPAASGSSIGVTVVRTASLLPAALARAAAEDERVLVEEFVPGREITVGLLDFEPLPPVEIVPGAEFYDYFSKYASDATRYLCPAPLGEEEAARVTSTAVAAARALGATGAVRVDTILDEAGRDWVLEVNTLPGMTERSLLPLAAAAAGLDFASLCERMVRSALARAGRAEVGDGG